MYQLGWRLGGKGATGRNTDPAYYHRIEEHGLHIWFGFYDNSFRQIKDCYAELGRAPDAPLATWQAAFVPANQAVFTESVGGRHLFWLIQNEPNLEEPGTGGLLLPLWEYALMALEAIERLFHETDHARLPDAASPPEHRELLTSLVGFGVELDDELANTGARLLRAALRVGRLARVGHLTAGLGAAPGIVGRLLGWAEHQLRDVERDAEAAVRRLTVDVTRNFMQWLWERVEPTVATDTAGRRMWILANLGFGCIAGALADGVLERGFDVINDQNFRPWLARHAFPDGGLLLGSPIVRAVYDSSFAYVGGDQHTPAGEDFPPAAQYEAGTALRGMLRASFTYKGAFGWRFAAGTGDTCYAPMYEVLKARGVKFEFFHRVDEVVCGTGAGRPIESIRMAQQVAIEPEQIALGGYAPLIDVKGLPCWPHEPLWDQIVNGDVLKESGVNLECPPPGFVDARTFDLLLGTDFDFVVLGISVAALPWLTPTLSAASPGWRRMLDEVKTVRTYGVQLWLEPTAWGLGWRFLGRPIASWDYDDASYLNVWGDLTELLPFEGWPVEHWPANIAYFTSAMPDDVLPPAPGPLPPCTSCAEQQQKARSAAIELLEKGAHIPWPDATETVGNVRRFRCELLIDARPGHHVGWDRIDSQWCHANVALSERYVLSVPGSSKHRLQANDANEFSNLYLAGDWTWCNLNSGCMEAATMSGMLCSLALSGWPVRAEIVGVDFG